jgi:hypothetical protein
MSEHLEATDDRQVTLARQDAIPIADGAGRGLTLTPASTLSISGEPKSSQAWPGAESGHRAAPRLQPGYPRAGPECRSRLRRAAVRARACGQAVRRTSSAPRRCCSGPGNCRPCRCTGWGNAGIDRHCQLPASMTGRSVGHAGCAHATVGMAIPTSRPTAAVIVRRDPVMISVPCCGEIVRYGPRPRERRTTQ